MKILILNGNPEEENSDFEDYLKHLETRLSQDNNEIRVFRLRELNIIPCTGCWDCWVKTPGNCSFNDDTIEIRKEYIHSDLVIFASPLIAGFVSSVLKKVMDKLIPLLHPYIEIVKGECHHAGRYSKYPLIGLVYQNPEKSNEPEIITRQIFNRFALNFRTNMAFSFSTKTNLTAVINEIDSY